MKPNLDNQARDCKILSTIMDENDDLIYLADLDTYELLYLNRAARDVVQIQKPEDYLGKPCYKLLQGFDQPCPFCTNRMLTRERFYRWEHFNAALNRYFMLRDKLVEHGGRLVRMEIATDITKKEQDLRKVANRLSVNETLLRCIDTLQTGMDVNTAIDKLLGHVGRFYQADRAYIFEIDEPHQKFRNTYEWCMEGVAPQIQNLQELPLSAVDRWLEAFAQKGVLAITSLGKAVDHSSLEYQILQPQGIESLIAVPLPGETEMPRGFIGVDNPTTNFESAYLLRSISNFITDDLQKRLLLAQLERLSYEDALTGLYNRNRYIQRMREFQRTPPDSLGVAFLDINDLKAANDRNGHAYGDAVIMRAADLLKRVFAGDVYRVGGDEFVVLCPNIEREEFLRQTTHLRDLVEREESLSISIGEEWTRGQQDAIALIMRADELMYQEKQCYHRATLTGSEARRAEIAKNTSPDHRFSGYPSWREE